MATLPSKSRIVRVEAGHGKPCAYPLHSLIATILDQHHTYLKNELVALEALLRGSACSHRGICGTSADRLLPVFLRFRKELEAHMRREEATLFPLIQRLELAIAEGRPAPRNSFGPLSNAIQFMNEDHGFESKMLGMMADITDGFACPPGASDSYAGLMGRLKAVERDLTEHVRKEDEMLFPEAIRLEEGGHLDE